MNQSATPSASIATRFPGLDGLRTILAMLVVLKHTEDLKYFFPSFPKLGVRSFYGAEAVQCFFVLSGFLITYLLLQEKDRTGQISVRQFYWKRVLRIWPLYFLITALSFFVLPAVVDMTRYSNCMQTFDMQELCMYLFFLPHWCTLLSPFLVLGASQLWSIGVEEQFYLFWPWAMRVRKRYVPSVLLACIFGKPLLVTLFGRIVASLTRHGQIDSPETIKFLKDVHSFAAFCPLETLAWGGLFGWLVQSRNVFWPRLLGHPISQIASWAALAAWLFVPFAQLHGVWSYHYISGGLVFGLAVWNIGANPRTLIGLRSRWLNKFGALSYGMYMWHVMVIIAVFSLANTYELSAKVSPWVFNTVLFSSVIGLTLLSAQLSYTWLEMPFLNLKDRWFAPSPAGASTDALPKLAAISSVPPSHGKFDQSERKTGSRAA